MELSVVCSTYGGQLSILKLFSYKPVGTIYIYKLKGHFLRIETNLSSCVNLLDTEVVLPPPPFCHNNFNDKNLYLESLHCCFPHTFIWNWDNPCEMCV